MPTSVDIAGPTPTTQVPASAAPGSPAPSAASSPQPSSPITIAGTRSAPNGGNPADPAMGVDAVVSGAFENLPGGWISWSYPALVTSVPGLLLLIAIAAQAFGALAWIPIVRRGLAGVGIDRRRRPRLK